MYLYLAKRGLFFTQLTITILQLMEIRLIFMKKNCQQHANSMGSNQFKLFISCLFG